MHSLTYRTNIGVVSFFVLFCLFVFSWLVGCFFFNLFFFLFLVSFRSTYCARTSIPSLFSRGWWVVSFSIYFFSFFWYPLGPHIVQEPPYLGKIALLSIWFRMALIQILTWVPIQWLACLDILTNHQFLTGVAHPLYKDKFDRAIQCHILGNMTFWPWMLYYQCFSRIWPNIVGS